MTAAEPDFSDWLHGLRTEKLRGLPPGARVVLSGGANSRWYFDWFEGNYPGEVERHIGVEALAPKPDDLPAHVEWVPSTLGDLSAVASGTVDLVFAGEVIEHLWPEDIAGFLLESHRVLKPGGYLALDSPNRRVTQPIAWLHPEHTLELTVDEIAELLAFAGFDDVDLSGVVLCYDHDAHRYLPLLPLATDGLSMEDRATGAADTPEDAFVWWAQAKRGDRAPDADRVRQRVLHLFSNYRAWRVQQLNTAIGAVEDVPHEGRFVSAPAGAEGPLIYGPYVATPPGAWRAGFDLQLAPGAKPPADEDVVAAIEVVTDNSTRQLARREIRGRELTQAPQWSHISADFALDGTTMGVEFRLVSTGRVALRARFAVDVAPPAPPAPPTVGETLKARVPLPARKVLGRARRRVEAQLRR